MKTYTLPSCTSHLQQPVATSDVNNIYSAAALYAQAFSESCTGSFSNEWLTGMNLKILDLGDVSLTMSDDDFWNDSDLLGG